MILRMLAVVVGCSIVGAMAHVVIVASGGYASPNAPLQIAVALGLCTGSVCVGAGLRDGRWILATVFVVALFSGEAYAILTTSEITLAARDAASAPLADLAAKRKAAIAELAAAEAASPAPADNTRLKAADAAKVAAETAVRDKAADKGCLANCRLLLQSAVDSAQREVAGAREELEGKNLAATRRLEDRRRAAKAAVASLPAARSSAPLADRLHVSETTLDLIIAALRSIAINGLGAALIAFGAHGRKRETNINAASEARPAAKVEEVRLPFPTPTARDHAFRFARDVLEPANGIDTPIANLHPAYMAWCSSAGQCPFPVRTIAGELADLFKRTGLEIVDVAGTKVVAGAKLRDSEARTCVPALIIG
ncbi:hypothetical protein RLW55_03260 [Hyphomicrobium sp. B1]|uniref:hypothetical protein n=1 Tax=Hyphomicrobium sp. B1 TaxID=3075651 RepID=UPI003C2F55B9